MSEQENTGLTLEGLAQRLEELERENIELRHKVHTTFFDGVEANEVRTGRSLMYEHGVSGVDFNREGGQGVVGWGFAGGVDPSTDDPLADPRGYGVISFKKRRFPRWQIGHGGNPHPKEKQSRENENREDESPTGIPHQKSTLPASPASAIH